MDLNRAQLIGNVTRDPEMRTTPSGQTVCNFGVATNSQWTDAQGQKQTKAEFHNIVTWGKLAEICGQYLVKGKKIYIEGRLQTRDWEAQDGSKRNRTEIVADNMIMLDRGPGGVAGSMQQGTSLTNPPPAEPTVSPLPSDQAIDKAPGDQEIRLEDIPF